MKMKLKGEVIEKNNRISNQTDYTFINNEIENLINESNYISFNNPIPEASVDNDTDMLAHLVEHTYDQGQGYEMTLNDTKIYGFRCANHKMNIAIREAIKMHQPILDLLKKLNKSNSHVRRSIELNSIFKNNKCRLRLENNTRWSSAYLLLESVKRAYDKNMFEDIDDRRCPIK